MSGRRPCGLLGMVGLALAVELTVARDQDVELTTVWASGWSYCGSMARRAGGCAVLCLGDSLVKFGVAPPVLERRLGGPALNLAMCVGQPPAALAVLRRALAAGARPRVILVDFTEHLLVVGPRKDVRLWPELLTVGECAELAWVARDATLLAELVLARLLPSVKDRYAVRAAVRAALRGEPTAARAMLPAVRRNWDRNAGAQLNPPGTFPLGALGEWFRLYYPERFVCDPVHVAYLDRFLALAARHGLPVVWLLPPYVPELQALSERKGIDAQFVAFVRSVQARHPGLVVLDGRHAGYPTPTFNDPIHLDAHGAAIYSAAVADRVAGWLASGSNGSRWLELPTYRDRPADLRLENLAESATALRR